MDPSNPYRSEPPIQGNPIPGPTPSKPDHTGRNVLVGCLITFVVVCILAVVGVAMLVSWFKHNAGQLGANLARSAVVGAIQQSELPEAERKGIIEQVDRVTDAFKAGDLTLDEVSAVFDQIIASPIMQIGLLYHIEERHIKKSKDLTDEEKSDAIRQIERMARGMVEGAIAPGAVEPVIAPLRNPQTNEIKPSPTADELREFVELVRTEADGADVLDESYRVTLSDEIKTIVDEALPDDEPAETGDSGL